MPAVRREIAWVGERPAGPRRRALTTVLSGWTPAGDVALPGDLEQLNQIRFDP